MSYAIGDLRELSFGQCYLAIHERVDSVIVQVFKPIQCVVQQLHKYLRTGSIGQSKIEKHNKMDHAYHNPSLNSILHTYRKDQ